MATFYRQYDVDSTSQRYFKKVWCLDNCASNCQIIEKSSLPNGCQNIAIVHGAGVIIRINNSEYDLGTGTCLTGQMTTKVNIVIKEHTKIILLQLYPWILSSLIDFDGFSNEIRTIEQDFLGDEIPLSPHLIACPEELVSSINVFSTTLNIADDETFVETICRYVFTAKGECKVAHI